MLVAVVNIGLTNLKLTVYTPEGIVKCRNSQKITTKIVDGRATQNPNEWIRILKQSFLSIPSRVRKDIRYITACSSSSCLIPVDGLNRPLYDCLLVNDRRAVKEAEFISKKEDYKKLNRKYGYISDASLMLPKILWFKSKEPSIFKETRQFLGVNEFIYSYLCGETYIDPLSAEKYYYDHNTRSYACKLLTEIGIDESKLPTVADKSVVIPIKQKACDELSLTGNVNAVITSYDAITSVLGSGIIKAGACSEVTGTVTSLRALTAKNIKSCNGLLVQKYFVDNHYLVGGSNNIGGGIFDWINDCFYDSSFKNFYHHLNSDIKTGAGFSKGVFFLPYLLGERAPLWDPNVRGVFFGLERALKRNDIIKSIAEGVVFSINTLCKSIERLGVRIDSVTCTGGGSTIPNLNKLRANIYGKPVGVLEDPESTSRGAFILMLRNTGLNKDSVRNANEYVKIRNVVEPDEEEHKKYEEAYEFFKDIYITNKSLFVKRREMIIRIRK